MLAKERRGPEGGSGEGPGGAGQKGPAGGDLRESHRTAPTHPPLGLRPGRSHPGPSPGKGKLTLTAEVRWAQRRGVGRGGHLGPADSGGDPVPICL